MPSFKKDDIRYYSTASSCKKVKVVEDYSISEEMILPNSSLRVDFGNKSKPDIGYVHVNKLFLTLKHAKKNHILLNKIYKNKNADIAEFCTRILIKKQRES